MVVAPEGRQVAGGLAREDDPHAGQLARVAGRQRAIAGSAVSVVITVTSAWSRKSVAAAHTERPMPPPWTKGHNSWVANAIFGRDIEAER